MNQAIGERVVTTSYALDIPAKKVIAQFSITISDLRMAPKDAAQMAGILLTCARHLDPDSVAGFTWPTMDKPVEMKQAAPGTATPQ